MHLHDPGSGSNPVVVVVGSDVVVVVDEVEDVDEVDELVVSSDSGGHIQAVVVVVGSAVEDVDVDEVELVDVDVVLDPSVVVVGPSPHEPSQQFSERSH